jgi:hypothetical protein
MDAEDDLYDEFGNYIGPEQDDDDLDMDGDEDELVSWRIAALLECLAHPCV